MNIAVTAPHGVAAWFGWAFAIAAPVASLIVSVVALYIAGGDRRREQRERDERRLETARMVTASVTVEVTQMRPDEVAVTGSVNNDADEPIQMCELTLRSVAVPHPGLVVLTEHFLRRRSEVETDAPLRVKRSSLGFAGAGPDDYEARRGNLRWEVRWTDVAGQRWSRTMTTDPVKIDDIVLGR